MNLAPTSGHRGFTLIELLVVIAIIGILSAVVLASLNTARNKGADAAIKSNLSTIQTQAELYYDNNGNAYATINQASGACAAGGLASSLFNDATIKNAYNSAVSANGGAIGTVCKYAIGPSGANYAVSVQLKTDATKWFCVDSTGNATTSANGATGGGASTAAVCS